MTRAPATRTQQILDHADRLASGVRAPVVAGEFAIAYDTREQNENFPRAIALSIPILVKKLDTGDLAPLGYESRCTLDRKQLGDFINCRTWERERFDRELERMSTMDFAAIMIEANHDDVLRRRYRAKVDPNAILSSAMSITVKHGVHVHFCGDTWHAADLGVRLLRAFWRKAKAEEQAASVAALNAAVGVPQ
jgi:ERCC4-type nuclease